MKKLIIFDYDGVIVDSFPNIHKVYQIICKKIEKNCPENLEEFKKTYGYNSLELAKNLNFTNEDIKTTNIIFREEIIKLQPNIFEGIYETLEELSKKRTIVLISSSARIEVMQKLEYYKLSKFFTFVFASDELGPMKKPKAIKESFEKFKVKPEEVIMIGDRNIDFDEAVEAGIPSKNVILVDYGWGYDASKIQDYKSKFKVKKPIDIIKAIEKLN